VRSFGRVRIGQWGNSFITNKKGSLGFPFYWAPKAVAKFGSPKEWEAKVIVRLHFID
jgi:hypothetical protein